MKETVRRVEKPWGHEVVWAHTDCYVGKVLHVKAGEALSVQMHEQKDETLYLLRGELRLLVGASPGKLEEVDLGTGESIRIEPRTVHAIEAVTDCDVLEVSTDHLDDVVRFRDRYGRAETPVTR